MVYPVAIKYIWYLLIKYLFYCFFIYLGWLFDWPDYLAPLWHMNYLTGSSFKILNISTQAKQTLTILKPEILQEITIAEYKKYTDDQYCNHG